MDPTGAAGFEPLGIRFPLLAMIAISAVCLVGVGAVAVAKIGQLTRSRVHEQARDQVCGQNEVPESAFRRMNLMLFLSVRRDGRRQIVRVWESDGQHPHRLIYEAGAEGLAGPSQLVDESDLATARQIIEALLASGKRTIEDVRAMVIQSRQV